MGEINKKDFKNGKIYCIRNWVDDDLYVGSTTQSLSKRMQTHRGNMYSEKCWNYRLYQKMRDIGKEHFYIELIEKYECDDIEELRKKEGEWIRKIGTLNQLVAGRTKQENYIENRDRILAEQREYNKNRKEEIKEYNKKRREDKREELSEQQKVKYQNKKEHYKQKSSENYYNNKEAIREKMNAKCACECGVIYSYGNRLRHFNSKHHQNFLNNNIDNVWFQKEKQQQKKHPKQSTYNNDEL